MESKLSLSVLVAVYNEQYLVEASLKRLEVLAKSLWLSSIRVIVVNDGSTDRTGDALQRFREGLGRTGLAHFEWIFLQHGTNQGKGAAVRTAIQHVNTHLAVFHDADLEYHPEDLLKMIPPFVSEQADAVYGSRFLAGDYRRVLFFRHSLGNKFLTMLTNIATDLNLTDVETCYKMVRGDLLKSIPLESTGSGSRQNSQSSSRKGTPAFLRFRSATPAEHTQKGRKLGGRTA
jgi:glycosyltransferase involved in cell wall biosynthesis